VWSNDGVDKGTTLAAWPNIYRVDRVADDATSYEFALPTVAFLTGQYACRAFLATSAKPYDYFVEGVKSTKRRKLLRQHRVQARRRKDGGRHRLRADGYGWPTVHIRGQQDIFFVCVREWIRKRWEVGVLQQQRGRFLVEPHHTRFHEGTDDYHT
jgi:hypothetical protein